MTLIQDSVASVLRVLADETRLRILSLLSRSELSVGEIARCLAMGQSRVSNHLRILREAGVISERHEGSYTYCRLDVPGGLLERLWPALAPALDDLEHVEADRRRLATVLAGRHDSRAFFDRVAGDWDLIGSDFTEGTGRLAAAGALVRRDVAVADVGCGTGYLARALAEQVARVVCVDSSPAMLEKARENLAGVPADVDFRLGELESLPLQSGEVDGAAAHMVLHHVQDVRAGLAEMARVVAAGGTVVCVDLLPHHETWMRQTMADARLGVDPAELETACRAVGLEPLARRILSDSYVVENPAGRAVHLPLFLVQARRSATG